MAHNSNQGGEAKRASEKDTRCRKEEESRREKNQDQRRKGTKNGRESEKARTKGSRA